MKFIITYVRYLSFHSNQCFLITRKEMVLKYIETKNCYPIYVTY